MPRTLEDNHVSENQGGTGGNNFVYNFFARIVCPGIINGAEDTRRQIREAREAMHQPSVPAAPKVK